MKAYTTMGRKRKEMIEEPMPNSIGLRQPILKVTPLGKLHLQPKCKQGSVWRMADDAVHRARVADTRGIVLRRSKRGQAIDGFPARRTTADVYVEPS